MTRNVFFLYPKRGHGSGARVYLWKGISRGEQHVLRFQVTMNDVLKVQMPQGNKNLPTKTGRENSETADPQVRFESGSVTHGK